jgi:hypothetical protein
VGARKKPESILTFSFYLFFIHFQSAARLIKLNPNTILTFGRYTIAVDALGHGFKVGGIGKPMLYGPIISINGAIMISENCSIDEFVETVKDKKPWEVIALAVEEATRADRLFYRNRLRSENGLFCGEHYSNRLKQLIAYLRYTVKPRRVNDEVYHLYTAHWGNE